MLQGLEMGMMHRVKKKKKRYFRHIFQSTAEIMFSFVSPNTKGRFSDQSKEQLGAVQLRPDHVLASKN